MIRLKIYFLNFCAMAPCILEGGYRHFVPTYCPNFCPEYGDSMFFRNIAKNLIDHKTSALRRTAPIFRAAVKTSNLILDNFAEGTRISKNGSGNVTVCIVTRPRAESFGVRNLAETKIFLYSRSSATGPPRLLSQGHTGPFLQDM
jgi:hypothetical protein